MAGNPLPAPLSPAVYAPQLGCEPVRKNNVLIKPPRHTVWSTAWPVPHFLHKLYNKDAEYTAEDEVIKLQPPTVQHRETIAEDPGCIDDSLFNYDEHTHYEGSGIPLGGMLTDDVLKYLLLQLQQLYRLDSGIPGDGWKDEGSPYAPLVTLYQPAEGVAVFKGNNSNTYGVSVQLKKMLEKTPYSIFLVHWGPQEHGHYFAAGYYDSKEEDKMHLLVLDSLSGAESNPASHSSNFVARFRQLWALQYSQPKTLTVTYPKCEAQIDACSCGLYAIYNVHRLLHAATVDENFEQVGNDGVGKDDCDCKAGGGDVSLRFCHLTGDRVRLWRVKLFKAYHEHIRQAQLRLMFADNGSVEVEPGYHESFRSTYKLSQTIQERAASLNINGVPVNVKQNIPYNANFVQLEKFNTESEFARLVEDWKNPDVAGVIIRLSDSNFPSEGAMYRAVGYGQTVLLSAHPVKSFLNWKRLDKASGKAIILTEEQVIGMCKPEFEKIKAARPDLVDTQLGLQRDFIAGQMCQATPKLSICPNKDGTTWAKLPWRRNVQQVFNWQVVINGDYGVIRKAMEGTVRLGDYAYIEIKGRPEIDINRVERSSTPLSAYPQARYIWAGKWPSLWEGDPWGDQLIGAYPPANYTLPAIWDWQNQTDMFKTGFQIRIADGPFEDLHDPYIRYPGNAEAMAGAITLAQDFSWPPNFDSGPVQRRYSMQAVMAFLAKFGGIPETDSTTVSSDAAAPDESPDNSSTDTDNSSTDPDNSSTDPDNPSTDASDGQYEPATAQLGETPSGSWARPSQIQAEKVVVTAEGATRREKREALKGWEHRILPRPTRECQKRQLHLTEISTRPHADAYLRLNRRLPAEPAINDPKQANEEARKRVYLAALLDSMAGPMTLTRNMLPGRDHPKGVAHRHHHHRPSQFISDHLWRVNYFTQIQPDRFPWPPRARRNVAEMINVCEVIREKKQQSDPADALEWRNFGHLLELGEKITELWGTTPLESRTTMRCLNIGCEALRKDHLKFEGLRNKAQKWKSFEKYQRWKYGAEDCPTDCRLRDFDCRLDCASVHTNPIDVSEAHMIILRNTNIVLELTRAQIDRIRRNAIAVFPAKQYNSPPVHWMPVKAEENFWDPSNKSIHALNERIIACEDRLLEWERLSDNERLAINHIPNIYYDEINEMIDDAGWERKSRDAQRLARLENSLRKDNPEICQPPPVINELVYIGMKRKIDMLALEYPLSKRIETVHGSYLRKLPVVTPEDFEKKLKFSYLREYW